MRAPDISAVSAMLASRISTLAPQLLPNGYRDKDEWRCGSVAGERGQSLGMHLTGDKAGIWSDFAGGPGGDALDLVAYVLFSGNPSKAYCWALDWLGLGGHQAPPHPRAP
jgi:hypothetical protein